MKQNFFPKAFFIALLLLGILFPKEGYGQNVFARKNLTSVSVDKLGEDEILLFKQSFESKNLSSSDALKNLEKKGMSEQELRKLKMRLSQLGQLDPGEQAQMLTMRLMQLQDSLQSSQKESAQLSGLERLYALDSNIFGAELFRSKSLDFAPNLTLATPPTYILGNGDIISLTVYGYQELNVDVAVKPDGTINIPYSGVVSVSGLTVTEAKNKVQMRLSANGYHTLANGSSALSLTLKEIRSVDVTVIGSKIPGRFTVPGIASPYHVLHLAGGPGEMGSYRTIFHMRNGKIVGEFDLYDLMGSGRKNDEMKLQDGDVIFIPPHSGRVILDGEFKRPRIFEMKPGESFQSIFDLAGGFTEQAFKEKVYLERVTQTGFSSRVISQDDFDAFPLNPGDHFIADTLNDRFRGRIAIQGGIQLGGYYGMHHTTMQLSELIQLAGGFREDAVRMMAVVSSMDSAGRRSYTSLSGENMGLFQLSEGDSILIPTMDFFDKKEFVQLSGEVNFPGEIRWAEGLTVWDVILLGGGFTDDAQVDFFELSTKTDNQRYYQSRLLNAKDAQGELIQAGDLVSVKRTRDREQVPFVMIRGEVQSEGTVGLLRPYESLKNILDRAGGLTEYADNYGAYVIRQRKMNVTDTNTSSIQEIATFAYRGDLYTWDTIAIAANTLQGKSPFILENKDELYLPAIQTSVRITGEVYAPKVISYNASLGFKQIIRLGGGKTEEGRMRNAYVVYPNGLSKSTVKYLFWTRYPKPVPGAILVIPQKPLKTKEGWSVGELSAFSGTLASISTMTIALVQLLRP